MQISCHRGDITTERVDAIVNAANWTLRVHLGLGPDEGLGLARREQGQQPVLK